MNDEIFILTRAILKYRKRYVSSRSFMKVVVKSAKAFFRANLAIENFDVVERYIQQLKTGSSLVSKNITSYDALPDHNLDSSLTNLHLMHPIEDLFFQFQVEWR